MKSEQIENLEEQTNILFKIGNKLEQRISKLEKVLQSHAKCIGELRGEEEIKLNAGLRKKIVKRLEQHCE